jgi:peroxiredoxin
MTSNKLKAGSPFPKIIVPKVGGGELELGTPQSNCDWQMVVVYRGRHCPLCARYLVELKKVKDSFVKLGINVVAVSGDPEAKAVAMADKKGLDFPVGYGLAIEQMKELGLYISAPRSPQETDRPFAEPGLFVVNAEGTVQVADISNAPFARPELDVLLNGLEYIRDPENDYPIRGTYE